MLNYSVTMPPSGISFPGNSGYEGPTPTNLEELTLEHEQLAFRQNHLTNYVVNLVTGDYDAKMVSYLAMVGKIHTNKAGSKDIVVPLVQMNALMGFVSDAQLSTILGLNLDAAVKAQTLRAFNKLLWLQNDLITRHYAA